MLYCFESWSEEEFGNVVVQKLCSGKNQISNHKSTSQRLIKFNYTLGINKLMSLSKVNYYIIFVIYFSHSP